MHLLVQFSDNWDTWPKLTDEAYEELRLGFPTLPAIKSVYAPSNTFVLTDDNKHLVVKHKLGVRIADDIDGKSAGQVLVKLVDRIEALENVEPDTRKLDKVALEAKGCAVQIHVPDLVLMTINEVQVLEDACTDLLQGQLDLGWRILAVCPPNAARRPDYVLGRNKRLAAREDL